MAINNRDNLRKEDIVKNIFLNLGTSTLYTTKIVNDLIEILIRGLRLTKKIKIKNFGIFLLQVKSSRIGRNPKDRKIYHITERVVATFKASDNLKKKINRNDGKK